MVAVPAATPVAKPVVAPTVAVVVAEDCQPARVVMTTDGRELMVAVATNCWVVPLEMVAVAGVMEIAVGMTISTSTFIAVEVTPSYEAVMVILPVLCTSSRPGVVVEKLAMVASLEVQVVAGEVDAVTSAFELSV